MGLPLLVVRQCSKLSFHAISKKTNEPNLKKWQKSLALLWPILPKFDPPKFVLLVLPLLDERHCYKLSLYAIPKKT